MSSDRVAQEGDQGHAAPRVRVALMIGLVVAAIGLRPQLIAIGPLVPSIERDLGLANAAAGLLTTIPLIGMGLCTLAAPRLVRRIGAGRAVSLSLAALAVAGFLRALAPDLATLIALTVVVGLGTGLAGAMLPVFVKEHFPTAGALATGIYTTAIQVGATVAAAAAAPLAILTGSWRGALAGMSLAGGVALAVWMLLTRWHGEAGAPSAAPPALRWRSPMAWWLALIFWLTALPFYGLTSWLAAAYVGRGWSAVEAGSLVAVMGLAGVPGTLLVAMLADRVGSRRGFLVGSAALFIAAATALIVSPGLAWVAAAVAGATLGGQFTLSLTLPLDVSHDPAEASGTIGLVLFVGYLLTAATPVGLGWIADALRDLSASLWVVVIAEIALIAVCIPLSTARLAAARRTPGAAS